MSASFWKREIILITLYLGKMNNQKLFSFRQSVYHHLLYNFMSIYKNYNYKNYVKYAFKYIQSSLK